MEPGWRGESPGRGAPWDADTRGVRPGYRSGQSGGWRTPRTAPPGGRPGAPGRALPGERIARLDDGGEPGPWRPGAPPPDRPFVAGEIADRGPLERGGAVPAPAPVPEPRARDAREMERQREWRAAASRAIEAIHAEDGTGPANAADLAADDDGRRGRADRDDDALVADDEMLADRAVRASREASGQAVRSAGGVEAASILPTIRVMPHGISRKRLEQAVRELQLPVIVARDIDEADVVMTLRTEYRQKNGAVREAESRGLPIYVLKSNTIVQMEASLTSVFALEVDPREAALLETEEAIGLVLREAEAVELSPQSAYIRRLQHQMAERANIVSRSRGREPYRRVRLYPDEARAWR
jgi:hypothetical protein